MPDVTRTRPTAPEHRCAWGQRLTPSARGAGAGSTDSAGPSVHSVSIRPPGGECACRRPSPLRRLPPRSLPGSRRGRSRRGRPVRSCCSRAPTARARPRCCGCSPGCAAVLGRGGRARPRPRRRSARALGATSRSSATRPSATTTSPCGRTCGSRRGPRAATRRRADAALERRRARSAGATSCTGACRRGSGAASRWRWRWSRDPRLLLLDEPHAGLDAEGRAVLDDVVRAAPAEGTHRAHRVPRARPRPRRSPTREVVLTAGQAHAGRRRRTSRARTVSRTARRRSGERSDGASSPASERPRPGYPRPQRASE